ncbi:MULTISPECIES: copper amine oxidase N-terminal domain-containing protein [unclassified Paenibacillus]|uniref:copper amine oxidase N-terminal domain-containing protein n=1 Tax=unclassified Paenibacillus TaxID=185978 RepID=UPI00362EBDFC
MKLKLSIIIVILLSSLMSTAAAAASGESAPPLSIQRIPVEHPVKNVIDNTAAYLNGWNSVMSPLVMQVNADGTTSVGVAEEKGPIHIYELDADYGVSKHLTIRRELPLFGSYAKDREGNYYILFGQELEENQEKETAILLAKYRSTGEKVSELRISGDDPDTFWSDKYWGVKTPFANGNCKLVISDQTITAYFGRLMFKSSVDGLNHQASFGFAASTDTLKRVFDANGRFSASAGHSFDQAVLYDGQDLLFVDQADASPRGFTYSKRSLKGQRLQNWYIPFKFKQGKVYQYTYAQLGGVVSTGEQYLFAGVSEMTDRIDPASERQNESRNIYLQTVSRSLDQHNEPIWITDYTDMKEENAAHSKLLSLGGDKYLVLWEKQKDTGFGSNSSYITTYMALVNGQGKVLRTEEMSGIRLGIGVEIHYNPVRQSVQWVLSDDRAVKVYELKPLVYTTGTPPTERQIVVKVVNDAPPKAFDENDIGIRLNGKYVDVNPKAKLVDGSTFIPLRGVLEAMGATVKWSPPPSGVMNWKGESSKPDYLGTVKIVLGSTTIELYIGTARAVINGELAMLADAPFISEDGSTYVPLRLVSETLGAQVQWEPEHWTAVIDTLNVTR